MVDREARWWRFYLGTRVNRCKSNWNSTCCQSCWPVRLIKFGFQVKESRWATTKVSYKTIHVSNWPLGRLDPVTFTVTKIWYACSSLTNSVRHLVYITLWWEKIPIQTKVGSNVGIWKLATWEQWNLSEIQFTLVCLTLLSCDDEKCITRCFYISVTVFFRWIIALTEASLSWNPETTDSLGDLSFPVTGWKCETGYILVIQPLHQ